MTPDEQQAERQALQTARDAVDDAWHRAEYHGWSGASGNAYAEAKRKYRALKRQQWREGCRRRLPVLSLLAFSLVMSLMAVLALYQTAH